MSRPSVFFAFLLIGSIVWADGVSSAEILSEPGHAVIGVSGTGARSAGGRSAHRAVTPEEIAKSIQSYLEKEWARTVKEVQVSVLEPSDPVGVPPGNVEWRVIPVRPEERLGRRHFQVAVTVNGKVWRTLEVAADVAAMIDAVALNRFVKPDEIIEEADLKSVRVRVMQLAHPFVVDPDQVIRKSAARPLPADTPLRAAFLKAPVVIKKGDRVLIEAKRGGLSVHAYGVTKSSGYVGQTIMVANADSGRELRAKVIAPGLVQVEF
ncbi:MAG: flagellar basal body P-ring formation chaperone FlgA [Nitrospira sp.]|nr:flagellar basal body P-ring formation chaperone FlgA [Nitrospira sp.]MCP9442995.1 flagellar basal body P-ring formation chaperone FlgA [Nitrospira sp.]